MKGKSAHALRCQGRTVLTNRDLRALSALARLIAEGRQCTTRSVADEMGLKPTCQFAAYTSLRRLAKRQLIAGLGLSGGLRTACEFIPVEQLGKTEKEVRDGVVA